MDILAWLWWALTSLLAIVWSLAWFLVGGWVSTLAQLLVIVLAIFAMKYGWQRAPYELWTRASAFGRFAWAWIRARDPGQVEARTEVREVIRTVRVKEFGDVNLSTLLSFMMVVGLAALAAL